MKLFKNRGDFYIPKSSKATKQAKILYSLLAVIVVFTAVFVAFLSRQYSSAAEFFARGEVTIVENQNEEVEILPKISGKINYLIMETDDSGEKLHYIFLLQADKDNKAYKAASLSPDTLLETETFQSIFSTGGGAALQTRLMEYFGFEIDYYAQFDVSSFVELVNKLGFFVYASNEDINFSGGGEDDKYTLKIKEGEQSVSGRETANLLRYFSNEEKNYEAENETALSALCGLLNADNFEKADSLFRLFMKSCKSDITVRDFENGKDGVMVFCKMSNDITVYSAAAVYDEGGALTTDSIREIKGYFSK